MSSLRRTYSAGKVYKPVPEEEYSFAQLLLIETVCRTAFYPTQDAQSTSLPKEARRQRATETEQRRRRPRRYRDSVQTNTGGNGENDGIQTCPEHQSANQQPQTSGDNQLSATGSCPIGEDNDAVC